MPARKRPAAGALLLLCTALAAAGCGEGAAGNPVIGGAPLEAFVGTWHYDQARGTIDCGGGPFELAPSGNQVFAAGVGSDLVDLSVSPLDGAINCNLGFAVQGTTAALDGQQTCTLTGGDLMQATKWRFTLLSAETAEEAGSANVDANLVDPTTGAASVVRCTYDMQALLTKVTRN